MCVELHLLQRQEVGGEAADTRLPRYIRPRCLSRTYQGPATLFWTSRTTSTPRSRRRCERLQGNRPPACEKPRLTTPVRSTVQKNYPGDAIVYLRSHWSATEVVLPTSMPNLQYGVHARYSHNTTRTRLLHRLKGQKANLTPPTP